MKIRYIKILVLVAFSLIFANFMFLSPSKLRWKGSHLKITVNTSNFGLQAGSSGQVLDVLKQAGLTWFRMGEASFSFSFREATNIGNSGIEDINCQIPAGMLGTNSANVYAESRIDPDCTGQSCSFIWSCDGSDTIRTADIQFNSTDNSFVLDATDQTSLKSVALHSLGHVIGLDHCAPGDTPEFCNNRATSPQTNPTETSVMHSFPQGLTLLSEDDRQGVQALYGVLNLPFSAGGPYALSTGQRAKDDHDKGLSTMDKNFIEYNLQRQIEVRRATIDQLNAR